MQKFRLFQRKNNEKRQQDKQTSSGKRASDFFLGLLGLCFLFLVMIGVPFSIIMTLLTLSGLPTSYAVMIAGFLFLIMAVIALFKLLKKKIAKRRATKCFQCLRPIDGHIWKSDNKTYCKKCYNKRMASIQQTERQPSSRDKDAHSVTNTQEGLLNETVIYSQPVTWLRGGVEPTDFIIRQFTNRVEIVWGVAWRGGVSHADGAGGTEILEADYFQKHTIQDFIAFLQEKPATKDFVEWLNLESDEQLLALFNKKAETFVCTKCKRRLAIKHLHANNICADCFVPSVSAQQIVPAPTKKQTQELRLLVNQLLEDILKIRPSQFSDYEDMFNKALAGRLYECTFEYHSEEGIYELSYWERGKIVGGIKEKSIDDFRFSFYERTLFLIRYRYAKKDLENMLPVLWPLFENKEIVKRRIQAYQIEYKLGEFDFDSMTFKECSNDQHHFANLEHFSTGSDCKCQNCGLVVEFNRGQSEKIDPGEAAAFLEKYAGSEFDFYYPPMFHKQNNLSEQAPSVSQKPIVTHEDKSDTAAKNIFLGEEYKLNLPKTLFRWSDDSSDRPGDNVYQHWEDVVLCEDGRLIIEENSITYSAHSIGHNTGRDTTTKPLSFDQLPKMIALAEDKNAQKYLGMNEQNWPKYVRVRKTNEELASELETVVTLDLDYSNWVELRLHKTTGRAYTVKGENVQHGGALIPSITSIKRAFLSEVSSMVAKEYDYAKAFKLLYPKWEEHLCRKVLVISDSRYRMGWFAVVDGVEIPREAIGFGETVFQVPAQLLTEDQHKKYAAYHTQTGPYEHYFDLPAECCEKVIRKLVPLASEK